MKNKTITIQQAKAKLASVGKKLRAGSFKHSLLVVSRDSVKHYDGAIAMWYGDWLLYWTEHHGYHVEHTDEVMMTRYFTIDTIPKAKKT